MEAKDTVKTYGELRTICLNEGILDPDEYDMKRAQAEISFRAGIREGVRRSYEDMKARHRIIDYDLEESIKYLESVYGKPN